MRRANETTTATTESMSSFNRTQAGQQPAARADGARQMISSAANELKPQHDEGTSRPGGGNESSTLLTGHADQDEAAGKRSIAIEAPPPPSQDYDGAEDESEASKQQQQDFDDELEADPQNGDFDDYKEATGNAIDEVAANETATATSVGADSAEPSDSSSNLNRRASLMSSFASGASDNDRAQPNRPALGSPLTSELKRLRRTGVKKMMQHALEQNKRRRRRRHRLQQQRHQQHPDQRRPPAATSAGLQQKQSNGNKKRETTTSLPLAIIKSMQVRHGLMSGGGGGGGAGGQSIGDRFYSPPAGALNPQPSQLSSNALVKQLVAANPLKQQLAAGSMQISTALQRLLANKFGGGGGGGSTFNGNANANNNRANHTQSSRDAEHKSGKSALHYNSGNGNNNQHQASALDEESGGDFSATSVTSSGLGEHFTNLLAGGQQQDDSSPLSSSSINGGGGGGGHTDQHVDFLTDMQNQLHQRRPPPSPTFVLEENPLRHRQQQQQQQQQAERLAAAAAAADYQSSASSAADRLAGLMSPWTPAGQQQQPAGHQADEALNLSQLMAAGGQSVAVSTATNKQLIPIEIIGLDPSVTRSILRGQQQQRRPLDETSGGPAASELEESALQFQAPPAAAVMRHHRQPIDQAAAYAAGAQSDESGGSADTSQQLEQQAEQAGANQLAAAAQESPDQAGRQKPSSVLHIHHFHHTQPAASSADQQQTSAATADSGAQASAAAAGKQVDGASGDQQQSGGAGPDADGSGRAEESPTSEGASSRVSKLMRASAASETPRAGAQSEAGRAQSSPSATGEDSQREEQQARPGPTAAWPLEPGDIQGPLQSADGGDTAPSEAGPNSREMRFVTRNSLLKKQQQLVGLTGRMPAGVPHNSFNGYASGGYVQEPAAYDPTGGLNLQQQQHQQRQQVSSSYRQFNAQRPMAGQQHGLNQRRPSGFNRTGGEYDRPFNDFGQLEAHTDPQLALSDAPPDGPGMLMVSYRPTGEVLVPAPPDGGGNLALEPQFEHHLINRTNAFPSPIGFAGQQQHGAPIRTGGAPFNEASESQAANQHHMLAMLQRQHPISTLSEPLARPSQTRLHSIGNHSAKVAPATGSATTTSSLLKQLIRQPKMSQLLLMKQLQSPAAAATAANLTAGSSYWSTEDERLLSQFNLANAAVQLRLAPGSLMPAHQHNHSLAYRASNQFDVDNLALLRQLNNQTLASEQLHSLRQQFQPQLHDQQLALSSLNNSLRLSSEELALVMQEQAIRQLQQQQQQASVPLLNSLTGGNPLSTNKTINARHPSDNYASNNLLEAAKSGRFELAMASDRSAAKYPSLAKNATAAGGGNVRLAKHFHVPSTRTPSREKDAQDSRAHHGGPEQVIPLGAGPPHLPNAKSAHPRELPSAPPQVQVAAAGPKQTSSAHHSTESESILDSAHGLGNLALGFIFFVSLMSFVLILISLIYRRRRAIGSARCGPSSVGDHGAADMSTLSGGGDGGLHRGGQKSLRCLNNLTQRTKHLMRSNFAGGRSSTSNVIAGSTPSSSLKSLNHLDSTLTSQLRQGHGASSCTTTTTTANNNNNNNKQQQPAVVGKKSNHLFVESHGDHKSQQRHGPWPQHHQAGNEQGGGLNFVGNQGARSSGSSHMNAKMSTFNVNSHLISGGLEKYSAPDDLQAGAGAAANSDIRTLNTRLQKAAYLQRALGPSSASTPPPPMQSQALAASKLKLSNKKQQRQQVQYSSDKIDQRSSLPTRA